MGESSRLTPLDGVGIDLGILFGLTAILLILAFGFVWCLERAFPERNKLPSSHLGPQTSRPSQSEELSSISIHVSSSTQMHGLGLQGARQFGAQSRTVPHPLPCSPLLPSLLLSPLLSSSPLRSPYRSDIFQTSDENIRANDPHRDFHDPLPPSPPVPSAATSDIITTTLSPYNNTITTTSSTSLSTELTSLFALSISQCTHSTLSITASSAKQYRLTNSGSYFRSIISTNLATREWIETKMFDEEDIYLITGLDTLADPAIIEKVGRHTSRGGGITLPVTTAVSAATCVPVTTIPVVGDILDPSVEGSVGREREEERKWMAKGEMVCGVEYRKVKWRLLSVLVGEKGRMEAARLERGGRWVRYDRLRDNNGGDEEVQMLEVELREKVEEDDV